MTNITPADVLAKVDSDLTDDAVQALIDDAVSQVDDFAGGTTEVETYRASGKKDIHLRYDAASITSVVERYDADEETGETLTVTEDYRLVNKRILYRVGRFWGQETTITYTVDQNDTERDAVIVDLVNLAIRYDGLDSESAGDYSASFPDYESERMAIMRRLQKGKRVVA